ncbi:PREDICTED: uncharacterized protein LOC106808936 [Priapulus caudatus]|uniref:Uncharacterized protein LOC106808936 n=1 Tax=Priapulus caudatus TaxID=37621 RepID=A0ABM1E573_PRICU|nr:PREDICTED: uncharacterized protein LOC106808936 [Priapulus caudatus]
MASPESGDKNTVEISRYEKERMAGVCIKEEEEIRGDDDADMDVIAAVLDNAIATVEVCELVVEGVSDAPPSTPGSGEVVSAGGAGDPQRDACAPCSPIAVPTCLRSVMLTNQDAREFLNKLVARRVEDFFDARIPSANWRSFGGESATWRMMSDYWRGRSPPATAARRWPHYAVTVGNPCSTSRLRRLRIMWYVP